MARAAHHAGTYHVNARRVRDAANADPHAICWHCGQTLAQHPLGSNGQPQKWTAAHTHQGALNPPAWLDVRHRPPLGQSWLAPGASGCNYADGRASQDVQWQATTRKW